jgi:Flp pilus assembly pilin Flp
MVAVAFITVVGLLGDGLTNTFQSIVNQLPTTATAAS